MHYTLSTGKIAVVIDDHGAQLSSIKNLSTDTEYLWAADPTYWNRHAPHLFPIVGKLKGDQYLYNNTSYTMSQHGFIRDQLFDCISEKDTSLSFVFHSNDETKSIYPFDFNFYVIYSLNESTVDVTYRVENLNDDKMFFSVGAHPGFLYTGELEDYIIEFESVESNESYRLTDDFMVSTQATEVPFEKDKKTIAITKELFNEGVYIFKHPKSNWVALKNIKTGQAVTLNFKGWKYLGIWSPPGAPFVCLEPWYGLADIEKASSDFTEKEGIEVLAGKATFECTHTMTIK